MLLFLLTSFCIFSGVAVYLFRIWGSSYTFSLFSVATISAVMYSMVGTLSENAMDISFSAQKSLLTESLLEILLLRMRQKMFVVLMSTYNLLKKI